MNIILLGYNKAACQILELMADKDQELYVFTHESPEHIPSLIETSERLNVRWETDNVSECEEIVRKFNPDVIVSIYYRYIVKKNILDIPLKGSFNLHPSLLPQYRGCSSLTWALINGETHAGITYHYMEESVDSGNIILQAPFKIENNDTQKTIYEKAMDLGVRHFQEALTLVIEGYEGLPQQGEPSFYRRGCPHDGMIDPNWDDQKIKRFIRAMTYPPLPPARVQLKDGSIMEVIDFEEYMNIAEKVVF